VEEDVVERRPSNADCLHRLAERPDERREERLTSRDPEAERPAVRDDRLKAEPATQLGGGRIRLV
jgi:hypothetical protein